MSAGDFISIFDGLRMLRIDMGMSFNHMKASLPFKKFIHTYKIKENPDVIRERKKIKFPNFLSVKNITINDSESEKM